MQELNRFREAFQGALQLWFRRKRQWLGRHYPDLLPIFDVGAEFTLRKGSKRIRPYLITLAYRMCGGKDVRLITKLALVAELVQSHLLIHDDIIDRDEERRDGPTAHVALRRLAPSRSHAAHYGVSQAILLGSLFGIWARELVEEAPLRPARTVLLLRKLEEMLAVTHYGQMLDVVLGESSVAATAQILEVYRSKTARYTVVGPLQFGAVAAGASARDLLALHKFGEPFGVAFQMLNDLHGVFPARAQMENTGMSDIAEGKKTLLFAYALEGLHGKDRAALLRLLRSRSASPAVTRRVRLLLSKSGARERCQREAQGIVAQGFAALTDAGVFGTKELALLRKLADFVILHLR